MSLLFVIITGSVTTLMIYLSVTDLKQKRKQMYKEKYEQSLRTAKLDKILLAGQEYYTAIQPTFSKQAIEMLIREDVAKYGHRLGSEEKEACQVPVSHIASVPAISNQNPPLTEARQKSDAIKPKRPHVNA